MTNTLFDVEEPSLYHGKQWGAWKLNTLNFTLECTAPESGGYYIDLEEIDSARTMLDWLFHIEPKSWVTSEMVGDLVRAFEEVFHARSLFCQSDKPFNLTAFKCGLTLRCGLGVTF
jgi:hypothetical protein